MAQAVQEPKRRRGSIPIDGAALAWLAFAVLWYLLGTYVVPPVIEQAYHGESVAWLNHLLAPYADLSFDYFQSEWRGITLAGTLAWTAMAGFTALMRAPAGTRIVGRARPGTLGAIRVLVCGVLLVSTLWEDLPNTAALPPELGQPLGVMSLLYALPLGLEQLAASPAALALWQAATALLLLLGMIGWKTRWVLPLAALGYLVLGGLMRQYAWFYHTGLLALYLLALLALLPAQDGWSLDRLLRLWRGQPVPPANRATRRYGWARYALWVALAVPYLAAGLSKLRNGGLLWWDAVNFKHNVLYCVVRPMQFDFDLGLWLTSAPDAFVEVMALTALIGELGYVLVLFFRWARWLFPAAMLLMHVGILLLQNILFFDLILLQLIFFNLRPLRLALGRRLRARHGVVEVAYDPASERHRRLVRVLDALDLLERIRWRAHPGRASMEAVLGARPYRGAALYRLLARTLPVLWPLVPALQIGRLARLAAPLAHRAADRMRPGPVAAGWASPRLVLGLTTVLLTVWVLRVEFYPLTAMQMFSNIEGPTITYEQAHAHFDDGTVVRAPIETALPALRDSRYRRLLQQAFDPDRAARSEMLLHTVMERWNREAPPERRITRIEVERRRWDFEAAPDDPDHGETVARRMVEAPTPARP